MLDWKLLTKQTMEKINNFKTFRANSGAIRFTMIVDSLPKHSENPEIYLVADECPHEKLITITFDYHKSKKIHFKLNDVRAESIKMPNCFLSLNSTKLWLSWYKNYFRMGLVDDSAFAEYEILSNPLIKSIPAVGFITFRCSEFIRFDIKDPPISIRNTFKQIEGGDLRWVKMSSGDELPIDALIGGYEAEPTYIARAIYAGSICPGKYVPSKQLAFIPWGHQVHTKRNFEILCGYNLMWTKCKSPYLPDNVYIAGTSEVRNEPLYIGRAMIDNDLVVGKVHMLYESCYLPYHGREICKNIYEVIAVCNNETCESNWNKKCFMINCSPPCS